MNLLHPITDISKGSLLHHSALCDDDSAHRLGHFTGRSDFGYILVEDVSKDAGLAVFVCVPEGDSACW